MQENSIVGPPVVNSHEESERSHQRALEQTGFWGRRAAGALFLAESTGRLLVAHRSDEVTEPGTHGTWGGAGDEDESPEEIVRREAGAEETGYQGSMYLIAMAVFRHTSGFQYDNFLAIVKDEFTPVLNWETSGFNWVSSLDEIPEPHHPGLQYLIANSGNQIDEWMQKFQNISKLTTQRAEVALDHVRAQRSGSANKKNR